MAAAVAGTIFPVGTTQLGRFRFSASSPRKRGIAAPVPPSWGRFRVGSPRQRGRKNAHPKVGSMPILELLEKEDFDPETIEMLVQCFEEILADLHLRMLTPSITLLVARRTIEIAKSGERDPVRLRQRVLDSLQGRAA